ncbi:glycosyltransferase family 2 protein [Helicobacter winghamensis]|uniref:Lipopolysaccharide biosynthesis protein n=1 Tax=Helicobacter winghamensis TaxID=157268 RepID=A0A2N3PKN2_9HELI|nr:glycosyltransferase family 2 protein [Helicobacter winghamensis]PKT77031.1 lipopolysaccharide biosynthesis protein [Helicobacter winghamensis]PKT77171.1 lipopolysaccharide biosynthesis protein [Helicobacter winghamensis]PKT77733.1 lipopolysaccharide biosynthesis protein [Helicobacter winghamensis]PKT81972.1 lipopolysaccharide biosynthesis protein [Helicobacter winghamensis]PKT82150.1 lipopolysaccharide biosynthesis protein [Helicobacter winghamensis]
MNILIPAAGAGSRFAKEGYEKPKPFIDVLGKPMIVRVLENLNVDNAHYIIILQKTHLEQEKELCNKISKDYNVSFVSVESLTEGTACSVLYARELINNNTPLMIANSDQIIDIDINEYINDCKNRNLDGSILCFKDKEKSPKWSFVRMNGELITEVKEKEVISDIATVGIYLFSKGSLFMDSAIDMIARNERVNNEFYTAPTYNYAIKNGARIGCFLMEFEQMHGIGTPTDLEKYIKESE